MAFRVIELDEGFNPVGELGRVLSIDISRDGTGDAPLLESATIEFDQDGPDWGGGWYAIEWTGNGRTPLGVFYFEAKERELDYGVWTVKADGYSVLYPASQSQMLAGDYVLAGSDAPGAVVSLLGGVGIAATATGAHSLPQTLVFEAKDTRLSAAWKILDLIGWCMRIEGDGSVIVMPYPTEPALEVSAYDSAGVQPGISEDARGVTYTREYTEARPFDLVRIDLPRNGVSGMPRILTQDLNIGNGVTIKERAGVMER